MDILEELKKLQKRVASKLEGQSSGNLLPWCYGPRAIILARYILNHFRADPNEHEAKIVTCGRAFRSELDRHQEFAKDPDVIDALIVIDGLEAESEGETDAREAGDSPR